MAMSMMSKAHPIPGGFGLLEVTRKPKALESWASGPDVTLTLMHNISEEGFSVPAHSPVPLLKPLREDCVLQTHGAVSSGTERRAPWSWPVGTSGPVTTLLASAPPGDSRFN